MISNVIQKNIIAIKENKYYLLFLVLLTTAILLLYPGGPGFPSFKLITLVFVMAFAVLLYSKPIRSLFLILSILGITMSILTPILNTPDEYVHLSRSIRVAEGQINLGNAPSELLITKDYFDIYKDSKKPLTQATILAGKSTQDKQSFGDITDFRQTNAYWFIAYIPQALGIKVGNLLGLSIGWTYYLGRIFNAIAYALLAYLAVKISGKFQQIMLMLVMIPMNLFLAASYNQDGVSLGIIYIMIALFCKYLTQDKKVQPIDLAVFTALCCITVTTKLPYFFLAFLLWFIPKNRFKDRKTRFSAYFIPILVFILTIFWFRLYQQIEGTVIRDGVNVVEQIKTMIFHPVVGAYALFGEMLKAPAKFSMVFNFGWLDAAMDTSYIFYVLFYTSVMLANIGKVKLKRLTQWGLALVSLAIVGVVSLSMYLTWTPVGQTSVDGVQGRYYLGVYLLWFILIQSLPERFAWKTTFSDHFVYKASILCNIAFIVFTLGSFY